MFKQVKHLYLLEKEKGEEQEEISVPALESCWLPKVELPELDVFTQYVNHEAWENGNRISAGTVIFSYPKYFRYEDPQLTCQIDGNYITVSSPVYAKSVEVLRGKPEEIRLRSVWDIR